MKSTLLGLFTLLFAASHAHGAGLARSASFLVGAEDQQLAESVLATAEKYRDKLAQEWLGGELPTDKQRVIIHVALSDEKDYGLTRIEQSPGDGRCHMMWIVTSPELINCTLAHEMTHIVLGCRYQSRIPVWANEGVACLQDGPERTRVRRRIIGNFARTGKWPALTTVLDRKAFATRDLTWYAVSASVTRFLLTQASKSTFVEFAVEGRTNSWDAALSRHYAISNVRELQMRWQDWVQHQRLPLDKVVQIAVEEF